MKKNIFAIAFTLCLCCIFAVGVNIPIHVNALTESSGGDIDELTDGISLSKTVTAIYPEEDDEGDFEYTLRLETFTTGTVTSTATKTTPADIVLVLDQSTSMMWPLDQQENLTYADAYSANNNFGTNSDTSITNNYGIIDGYYEEQDVDIDGDLGEETEEQYVWVQNDETTVSKITVPTTTTNWVSNSAPETVTLSEVDDWSTYYKVNYGYLFSESRQKVLIDSVLDFIYTLDKTANHRISIVTYHNTGIEEWELGYVNEGTYQDIAEEVVGWVTATGTTDNANSTTAFNLQHSTGVCYGMSIAEEILADAKYERSNYDTVVTSANLTDEYDETGRTQMAVIFTDGIPTQASTSGTASTLLNVNDSLADAQDMKQNGVTIFSIGMLDGVYSDLTGSIETDNEPETNPDKASNTSNATSTYYADYSTLSSTNNRPNTTTTYYVTYGSSFISSFLDLLSSNYKDADEYISDDFPNSSNLYAEDDESTDYSISNTYDKTVVGSTDDGSAIYSEYYYPIDTSSNVNVAETLNGIFETVAGEMSSSATYKLDTTAQVRDVMSAEFEIPVSFKDNSGGDYAKCSTTGVYYYAGDGLGSYDIDIDIDLYVAYCTGENNADDADTDKHNSGYYTWSADELVYSTSSGVEDSSFSDLDVFVRTAFIDTRDGHETTVYYYSDYEAGTILYAAESDDGVNDDYFYIMYGTEVVVLSETQTVIVEGFDYNSYYVTTTDKTDGDNGTTPNNYGAKLILQFDIAVDTQSVTGAGGDTSSDTSSDSDTGTFGGNGVNTNTAASGIYIQETDGGEEFYQMLEAFPVPAADVDISIDLTAENQTIYLGNSISIPDLLTIGSGAIDGVNNAFVNITFYIYEDSDGDGNITDLNDPILTVTIPAGETAESVVSAENLIMPQATTTYVIQAVVDPVADGVVATEVHASDQFSVYVLYPDIQTNSIWVDYGTPVILREDNVVKPFDADFFDTDRVTWEHSEVLYSYIEDGSGAYNLDKTSAVFTYATGGAYKLIESTSGNYDDYVAIFGTYSLYDSADEVATELETGVYATYYDGGSYTFEYVGSSSGDFNLTTATYSTVEDSDPVTAGYYELTVPEPNEAIPPTVIFGYTGSRGVEYTSDEYESYGAREDNEFYISSMTITSSDDYETVTRYDVPESDYEFFSVNINRFDLQISKLVEAADYDIYPQSFVFDVAFTGSAFETQQKISMSSDDLVEYTDDAGNAVYWQPTSKEDHEDEVDVTDGTLYYSASDNDGNHDKYDESAYEVSTTIGYDDYYYYKTGFHYDLPDTITVSGTEYELVYLYDDGESVMGTSLVDDVDKVVQLVMEEDEDGKTKTGITKTEVWINDSTNVEYNGTPDDTTGYTKYYKFTGTIVDLYCGLEITVTEDTDWSWRYTPGFEIEQFTENQYDQMVEDGRAIIAAVYPELESGMSNDQILEAIEGYLDITFDKIDYYGSTWSEAGEGSITYTRTNDILSLRIKSYDEYFTYYDDDDVLMTLRGVNYNDYDNLDIAYYTNAVSADFDNETVADVTINSAKDEAVIFVSNSSYYLDYNGDRTDISGFTRNERNITVGSKDYTIYTNPPASPFTIYPLYAQILNDLVDEQWLSYRNWTDNQFTAQIIGGGE